MTRRLRMAGVGLCAFMLPACSSMSGQSEQSSSAPAPGYVVMPRTGGAAATGLRQQLAGGQYASSVGSPAAQPSGPAALTSGTGALADAPIKSVSPPADLPVPVLPSDPVMLVKNEQTVGAEGPAIVDPIPAQATKVVPHSPTVPSAAEPTRLPAWPSLGANGGDAHPLQLPDNGPKVEGAPAIAAPPVQSSLVAPPAENLALPEPVRSPEPVRPPETSVSLKVPEPPAAMVRPMEAPATSSTNESILVLAIKAFQANRPREALDHLKRLDATNQELLMYLMPLMVRLSEGNAQALPPEELAMLIDRLQAASSMLKSKATLQADRVCFCRGVRKFADLDAYEAGYEFRPGDMVFLYAELKNFTCEPVTAQPPSGYNSPTRGCHIRLGTTLELRDARNNLVWRSDLHKNDFAQTPPQDYYHTYRFCVPEKLPAGNYTLWLNVVDKPTGRLIRKPIEMRIGQS